MKKYIKIIILMILSTGMARIHAEEKIDHKNENNIFINKALLKKTKTLNITLWAFLKDTQRIANVSNLNIRELELIFNNGKQFLPVQESADKDLEHMSLAGYYTNYTSAYNSAKYYITVKSRMSNHYPIGSDKDIQIKLIVTPNSNQCIKSTGIHVFNKELVNIASIPPLFHPAGNTEEEKLASTKKFIEYNTKYYPKYYLIYDISDEQRIGFDFAQNDCLLSVNFIKFVKN